MNLFQSTVLDILPGKRKTTPSGWISFNAVCCHNRGENRDTRQRGGIHMTDEGWNYHCFNCGFKAGWSPGHNVSKNTKNLLSWFGLSAEDISKLNLFALKNKEQQDKTEKIIDLHLESKNLPDNTESFQTLFNQGCEDPDFINVVSYVLNRGMKLEWYDWYWCSEPGYRDRVLLPVFYQNRIIGWTARKIKDGKPKYLTDIQPGSLFNLDRQTPDKSFVILVEGPFDAIAVDGISAMTNDVNEIQATRIKNLGKPVILVPDRDLAGSKFIDAALKYQWSISCPNWDSQVKDCADAVLKYGRIYTLLSIVKNIVDNPVKQQVIQKQLANR